MPRSNWELNERQLTVTLKTIYRGIRCHRLYRIKESLIKSEWAARGGTSEKYRIAGKFQAKSWQLVLLCGSLEWFKAWNLSCLMCTSIWLKVSRRAVSWVQRKQLGGFSSSQRKVPHLRLLVPAQQNTDTYSLQLKTQQKKANKGPFRWSISFLKDLQKADSGWEVLL